MKPPFSNSAWSVFPEKKQLCRKIFYPDILSDSFFRSRLLTTVFDSEIVSLSPSLLNPLFACRHFPNFCTERERERTRAKFFSSYSPYSFFNPVRSPNYRIRRAIKSTHETGEEIVLCSNDFFTLHQLVEFMSILIKF